MFGLAINRDSEKVCNDDTFFKYIDTNMILLILQY